MSIWSQGKLGVSEVMLYMINFLLRMLVELVLAMDD